MSRPSLLAVSGLAPWPVRGGFALRAAGLLEALGDDWDISLVVAAASRADAAEHGLREIVAVPGAEPWRPVPRRRADHGALRRAVAEVVAARRPEAALLFNGTEFLAFDDFPPAVADRIDCGALERRRYVRYARNLRGLRALVEARAERRYERRVVRRLAATTVAGEDDAEALRRLSDRPGAVRVIVNGVPRVEGPAFEAESERPTVLFTGTLSYYANADAVRHFVRRIWPLIRKEVPEARFVAAGRTPPRGVLALADEPGVEVRADVPDIFRVIRASWVTVAPMRCGAGVKNKVLEAWAVGRPAVLTALGANGIATDERARALVADEPAAFAARVVGLLRDAALRHEHGRAARTLARQRHDWARSAARMTGLLRGVAYQSRSAS